MLSKSCFSQSLLANYRASKILPRLGSTFPLALAAGVLLAFSLASSAQNPTAREPQATSPVQHSTKRLILKDGSYQMVTEYHVGGERVRYFSAEREEWEELPKELVDWPATEKYDAEETAKDKADAAAAAELDKQLALEHETTSNLPEVAPGLRVPHDNAVFLLDNVQGESQLVEILEAEGDINQGAKGNIFHGAVAKQAVELEGEHAKVQCHVDIPSFYINLEPPPDAAGAVQAQSSSDPKSSEAPTVPFDRFRIVRTQAKSGKRVLAEVKRGVTGKMSQDQHFEKTTTTKLVGGWLKLTPAEPLVAGEYAVVEMMDKEGMNLYVWDFGINPNAPANANPWKPAAKH